MTYPSFFSGLGVGGRPRLASLILSKVSRGYSFMGKRPNARTLYTAFNGSLRQSQFFCHFRKGEAFHAHNIGLYQENV